MGYFDAETERDIEDGWRRIFAAIGAFGAAIGAFGAAIGAFGAAARAFWERRPARAEWRNAALDVVGWFLALYSAAGRALSAVFTVRWDPLARSWQPILIFGAPSRIFGVGAFVVGSSSSERERRIVAWFYRWHEAPDDDDWRACLARFGLDACPAHTLQFGWGREVTVLRIRLAAGADRGARVAIYRDATHCGEPDGYPAVSGPTPLGGLSPSRLIADSMPA